MTDDKRNAPRGGESPNPKLEGVGLDATLPGAQQSSSNPEDLGAASTLPQPPASSSDPEDLGAATTLPAASEESHRPIDDSDALGETVEIYAPPKVTDPLAKLLGVADGLINPDAGSNITSADPIVAAKAEYAQRYELREEVGRGGIGRVLLAFDPRLGREVALKELLPRFASGKSVGPGATPTTGTSRSPAEVRFLDEARITAQLEHPGIVPVHELGQRADGSIFYAMRMVRGRDMKKALRGRGLRERLELIPNYLELCHAIAYAHSRGVVHRDLKPDNVMLGEFGETVVLDWGLAKVRGKKDRRMEVLADEMELLRKSSGTETVMGAPLGTPTYMPPEQAAGKLDEIDERSDVYSLGAILYEQLTGRTPHSGSSALEVLERVQKDEIVPPDQLEGEAPPELAAICMRALARQPGDRYDSAKLLAEDVRRFQVGGLVRAHSYSMWDLARRWLVRHRRAIAVVSALLTVAAAMWWYRGYADTQRSARAEQQRKVRVRGEVEQILSAVARGPKVSNWLDVYTFKLIALKEPLVEQRLVRELAHPEVRVRMLVSRSLGGMKSRRAVELLCARLAKGVEPSETVVIAVINALGIIGDSRANDPVSRARFHHGQFGAVWRNTKLAFRMIPLPPLPKTGGTADQLVDRGRDSANKGYRKEAIALYSRALVLDPKLARAHVNRAIERKLLENVKGALADYGRAIALDPKDPAPYLNRSYILKKRKRYSEALADLDRVVASPKYRSMGLSARALVYRHMGRLDDALKDYRASFVLRPDRATIPFNMAFVWAFKGDPAQALALVNQALKIQPSYTRALVLRASIRRYRGDLAGALLDTERAVTLDPAYSKAYLARGRVELARGRRAAAKADFDKVVAGAKKEYWPWGARAAYYHYELGQYAQAARDFAKALSLSGSAKIAHQYTILLAAVALRAGDRAAAKRRLQGVVVKTPPGAYGSAVGFVTRKLDRAAFVRAEPFTSLRKAYLSFLEGLGAELAGDLPAALKAYTAALSPYPWDDFWYGMAAHNAKVLGQRLSPSAPDPDPDPVPRPQPRLRPRPRVSP